MTQVEKMIPVKKLVWALAAAGVLGVTGGALAMRTAKLTPVAQTSADGGSMSGGSSGDTQVAAATTPLANAAAPSAPCRVVKDSRFTLRFPMLLPWRSMIAEGEPNE